MGMKNKYLILPIIIVLLFMVSCTNEKDAEQEKIKPVKVLQVVEEGKDAFLNYTGSVAPQDMIKVGFKSPGKITRISVQKGDYIKRGQVLAQIDSTDLEYALKAAEANLEAARAQYNKALNGASQSDIVNADLNVKKAQDAYDFANNTYNKLKILYDAGGISKNDLDKAKLELDIRTSELEQAKEISRQVRDGARNEDKAALLAQVEAARVDVEYKKSMVQDAIMKSDADGYVVDVLNKEGEFVSAGYPVVVIRKEGMVVNVGVSQNDIAQIKKGTKANIIANGESIAGEVTNISQVPDNVTRTYNVEVAIDDESLAIGSIVKVEILTGQEKGIWIPIQSVVSGSEDYVFVVNEGIAQKKKVSIENIKGSSVRVNGISPGDMLVIEGMSKLKDRDKVAVQ